MSYQKPKIQPIDTSLDVASCKRSPTGACFTLNAAGFCLPYQQIVVVDARSGAADAAAAKVAGLMAPLATPPAPGVDPVVLLP